jgi:hypothetical protein
MKAISTKLYSRFLLTCREELQKQVELAKRDKKRLRKKLKKFEDDFLERTGRSVYLINLNNSD